MPWLKKQSGRSVAKPSCLLLVHPWNTELPGIYLTNSVHAPGKRLWICGILNGAMNIDTEKPNA